MNYDPGELALTLNTISGVKIFNGGVSIGPGKGKLVVRLENGFHDKLKLNFSPSRPDNHILNVAYQLADEASRRQVILVSKDVNMRMKAKSLGLLAEDYTTDQVKDITELYKGCRTEENIPADVIDRLYAAPYELDQEIFEFNDNLYPNEFLVLKNGRKSALAGYNPFERKIRRIDKTRCCGIMPRNAEQAFAINALTNPDVPLVTLSGKAGTGKTLLALSAALETKRRYRQIFIARPIVPLSNKDTGYLPGDIQSKLDPYMQPLYDNLAVIQDHNNNQNGVGGRISELIQEEKIVITPLSYIRGRSLVKIFFVVDEAQNLTPHEVKTIITRAGAGTKIVFTGDVFQIDHPYLDSQSNGLSYLIEKMKGQKLYGHINLEKGERSELSDLAINLL